MHIRRRRFVCEHRLQFAHRLTRYVASQVQLDLGISLEGTDTKTVEVWLLLTRHVINTKRTGEFISLLAHDQSSTSLEALKVRAQLGCLEVL